jgi:hypothetical protein
MITLPRKPKSFLVSGAGEGLLMGIPEGEGGGGTILPGLGGLLKGRRDRGQRSVQTVQGTHGENKSALPPGTQKRTQNRCIHLRSGSVLSNRAMSNQEMRAEIPNNKICGDTPTDTTFQCELNAKQWIRQRSRCFERAKTTRSSLSLPPALLSASSPLRTAAYPQRRVNRLILHRVALASVEQPCKRPSTHILALSLFLPVLSRQTRALHS